MPKKSTWGPPSVFDWHSFLEGENTQETNEGEGLPRKYLGRHQNNVPSHHLPSYLSRGASRGARSSSGGNSN